MKFSVIIPTYNRCETLAKTLSSIESQNFSKDDFEVIIVDDSSGDSTRLVAEEFSRKNKINIRYFFQEHLGHGRAKNTGIENARGEILLFCGDDTIFDKHLLEKHNEAYQKYKEDRFALLGLSAWDESIGVSDFMRYLAPNGPQFHFGTIKNFKDAGWHHFYTCNISVPKVLVGDLRFDERFVFGFEDIDFGLRLTKKNVKIYFDPAAIVYHSHPHEPANFYKRMFLVGNAFILFTRLNKKNRKDYWEIKFRYAPFDLFPGQVRLFNFLTKKLSSWKFLERRNKKLHWFFNVCYHYSSGIIKERKKYESTGQ